MPAEAAEQRVLEHLRSFVGDVEGWIGDRLAERSADQVVRTRALKRQQKKLSQLERTREQRMTELTVVGITAVGLEVVERIDQQIQSQQQAIDHEKARLGGWSAGVSADAVLDFYNGVVDLIQGRIARAQGIAEVNAALHDSLTGVRLSYDGTTLIADVSFRPTGDDYWDECLVEMFGTLEAKPGAVQAQQEALVWELPHSPPRSR